MVSVFYTVGERPRYKRGRIPEQRREGEERGQGREEYQENTRKNRMRRIRQNREQ
jgi:hypothetical protein